MARLLSPFLLHPKKLLPKGVMCLPPQLQQIGDKAKTRSIKTRSTYTSSTSGPWVFCFSLAGVCGACPSPHPAPCISGLSSCLFGRLICWSRPINLPSHHSKYQPASVVCSNAWKQARLWPFAKSHLLPGKSSPWLFSLPQLWR